MPDVARETRDHPPKRLMGCYDICQTPLFLATNGKRPVHLTYDFSLRHIASRRNYSTKLSTSCDGESWYCFQRVCLCVCLSIPKSGSGDMSCSVDHHMSFNLRLVLVEKDLNVLDFVGGQQVLYEAILHK